MESETNGRIEWSTGECVEYLKPVHFMHRAHATGQITVEKPALVAFSTFNLPTIQHWTYEKERRIVWRWNIEREKYWIWALKIQNNSNKQKNSLPLNSPLVICPLTHAQTEYSISKPNWAAFFYFAFDFECILDWNKISEDKISPPFCSVSLYRSAEEEKRVPDRILNLNSLGK